MRNKLAAILGLLAGTFLLLFWGGEAPGWLLKLECLCVLSAALAFGFGYRNVQVPHWVHDDAVQGVALVYLGVGAMFMPLNFLASAFLIGHGARLVMKSAGSLTARIVNPSIANHRGDIVIAREGGVSRRP